METSDKLKQKENEITNGFTKEIASSPFSWLENVTTIDLSNKNLSSIEDNVTFPPNLIELNLSHNKLRIVPSVVVSLEKLSSLDVSYNEISLFDETPCFCHSLVVLNLSRNQLLGPPYWVWVETPAKLLDLDLSFNVSIKKSFENGYFEELLQYQTPVINLKMNNCELKDHLKILRCFSKAQKIDLGSKTLTHISANRVIDLPCEGLENCCDIESLNLNNTHVYSIKKNIDVFSNLKEINLSHNYISGLPLEFCNLVNLEVCILSNNSILYLPDEIGKLKKLVALHIDSNELCLLPDSITELTKLEYLDIYNNCLYEFPDEINWVTEVDVAQNYFDEPENSEYIEKKEKLRLSISGRCDGRKIESVRPESEHSRDTSDDEGYLHSVSSNSQTGSYMYNPPSSPEDWDSDDYWVPRFFRPTTQPVHTPWFEFVEKKMSEGNFCPMDAHTVPIAEKVKYEKICNPKIQYESDGQFDDLSEDDN